ncbi:MAG: sigma factor-like helix-turn-helix DNA-binding protein [Sphingomonas sp.]
MSFATVFRRLTRFIGKSTGPLPDRSLARARIAAACDLLPEPTRSVYLMSARDDLSFEVIARRLDLPVASVERELAAALVFLASCDNAVTSPRLDR